MVQFTWAHVPELAGTLTFFHFPATNVVVEWEDGSRSEWRYAFWRREGEFVVVYTEHCGYHTLALDPDEDQISGQEGPNALSADEQERADAALGGRRQRGPR